MAKKLNIVIAALLFCCFNAAYAGGGGGGGGSIVFDPTNFGKNTITAAQSIAMEARQAAQYATQLQQYMVQIKQQMPGDSSASNSAFNNVQSTYNSVTKYQSALSALQGSVGNVRSATNTRMSEWAASGLSWDQYVQRERSMLKYKQDNSTILTEHERQVMEDTQQRYQQVREIQPQIVGTQGTHESMRIMNTQMNMLNASMQDLITVSAADSNRINQEELAKAAREQRAIDSADSLKKLKDKNDADSWDLINKLNKK